MADTTQLLNWYWWRNRFSITMMVSSVVIAQTAFWLIGNDISESQKPVVGLLLGFSMLASFFCSIEAFSDGRDLELTSGQSAFPNWLFTLPISSFRLAMVPVVAMMIALAWAWLPFAWAIHFTLPTVRVPDLVVLPWLGMCAAASWLQFAAWRPWRSGWHRLAAILVAIFLAALVISISSVMPRWFPTVAVIVATGAGIAASISSVSKARYHGWRSQAGATDSDSGTISVLSNAPLTSFTKLNLNSSMAALRWRDWHRIGKLVVFFMSMIALPVILLVIFAPPSARTMLIFLMVPTSVISSVALTLGRNSYLKSEFELSPFLSALPVPDRRMMQSRVANSLKISVVMWFMALLVLAVWLLYSDHRLQLNELAGGLEQMFPSRFQSGWPLVAGFVLFSLYTVIVTPFPGLAIGLCGRKRLEMTVIIVVGAIGFVALMTLCFYAEGVLARLTTPQARSQYVAGVIGWIPGVLWSLLMLKILVTAISLWVAGKRVSFHWSSDGPKLVVGIVACLILAALFCQLIPASLLPMHSTAIFIVLLFPCASLILATAALDWNRHR